MKVQAQVHYNKKWFIWVVKSSEKTSPNYYDPSKLDVKIRFGSLKKLTLSYMKFPPRKNNRLVDTYKIYFYFKTMEILWFYYQLERSEIKLRILSDISRTQMDSPDHEGAVLAINCYDNMVFN